ncbi:MAG: hypothetical protein C0391_02665 [Anaerolinea sp.]|nr:hypothetical protein [Anaerolinea sp.]
MSWLTPTRMIWLAFCLMLMGVILPLLMVIKVVESTFFLNFFSYGSSLVGMILGTLGAAFYASSKRKGR